MFLNRFLINFGTILGAIFGPKTDPKTHPKMESNGGSETRLYQDLLKHLPTTGRQRRVIEMGAFDGQSYSISWTLEYCLGWLAVLVEANPKMFDKIVGYRPNAHTLQLSASCATDDRNLEFMSMPYTGGKLIKSSGDREEAKKRGWYSASHCGPLEAYVDRILDTLKK